MKMAFIVWILENAYALSATWYVRPGVYGTTIGGDNHPVPTVGFYGAQDGSSYANAWNGITSIVWGGAGVNPGDTLYVCGLHIYSYKTWTATYYKQAMTDCTVSGFTVRMDYPGDKGTIFGGVFNYADPQSGWDGPDANGVYRQKIGNLHQQTFEVHGSTITRMNQKTNVTWTDGPGEYYLSPSNYVKMSDGSAPLTNTVASYEYGWAINLNKQSNIVFQSCNFISDQPTGWGGVTMLKPSYTNGIASNHITWTNCTIFDSDTLWMYPDEDDWSFLNCEMARMPSAIYTILDSQGHGAQRLIVKGCYFHDTATTEYPSSDGHSVGIQGGDGHLVTGNICSNTGPAIVFWTGSQNMRSNTISFNYIANTKVVGGSSGTSAGISISGNNSTAVFGVRSGFKVFRNVIVNTSVGTGLSGQGLGITGNLPDYIEICNNTIVGGNRGIDIEVVTAGYPISAKVENNIISQPTSYYYYMASSTAPTNLVVDYNLLYPVANSTNSNNKVFPPAVRDIHSVFSNPLLTSDFHLSSGSPAIGTGDHAIAPDIGAYPFVQSGPSPLAPTILTITRSN